MTTKAAAEFRQRKDTYDESEDGLNFKSWYAVDDMKRIIWKKFSQLDPVVKKDTLQPFVFFDGLGYTIEDMLKPLVTKLKKSSQKYFPFIFKPEAGAAHYVAGFLRKNADETVSIILFNPTGTTPRANYGDYAYKLQLLETDDEDDSGFGPDIEKNSLYFTIHNNSLQYTVLNPEGKEVINSFSAQELKNLGIVLNLKKPLTAELIKEQLKPKTAQILEITLARGDTENKIEIISSTKKIQTHEKDRGPLVSCGPLTLAFIEYVMNNPLYMANLDKEFHLPKFLNVVENDEGQYRDLVNRLRQEHFQVLDTIEDSVLKSEIIDSSYAKVTASILNSLDPDGPEDEDEAPDPENRVDVQFIRGQINRFRENAKCLFSINNGMKANAFESALDDAIKKGVQDVRADARVKDALAIHRIFGFFGYKQTTATIKLEESLAKPCAKQ